MNTQEAIMSTQDVANKLVEYCRAGQNDQAIAELYADDIISHEQPGAPQERTEGKEAVLAKTEHWVASVAEIHNVAISDAIVAGDYFSVGMHMDVTYKEHGRMQMDEIAVYQVKDGKIVSDQFFYNMGM